MSLLHVFSPSVPHSSSGTRTKVRDLSVETNCIPQFVVTTHNTSIKSNDLMRPDCYYLMNGSHILPLSKCTGKELREAHNIEKIYRAGAFYVG